MSSKSTHGTVVAAATTSPTGQAGSSTPDEAVRGVLDSNKFGHTYHDGKPSADTVMMHVTLRLDSSHEAIPNLSMHLVAFNLDNAQQHAYIHTFYKVPCT
jgi:hypothetical protein